METFKSPMTASFSESKVQPDAWSNVDFSILSTQLLEIPTVLFKPVGQTPNPPKLNQVTSHKIILSIETAYRMYLANQNSDLKYLFDNEKVEFKNTLTERSLYYLIRAINETQCLGQNTRIDDSVIPNFKAYNCLNSLRFEFLMSLQNARHYLLIKRDFAQFKPWFEKLKHLMGCILLYDPLFSHYSQMVLNELNSYSLLFADQTIQLNLDLPVALYIESNSKKTLNNAPYTFPLINILNNYSIKHHQIGNTKFALELFKKSLNLDSTNSLTWSLGALYYLALEQKDEASKAIKESISQNHPDSANFISTYFQTSKSKQIQSLESYLTDFLVAGNYKPKKSRFIKESPLIFNSPLSKKSSSSRSILKEVPTKALSLLQSGASVSELFWLNPEDRILNAGFSVNKTMDSKPELTELSGPMALFSSFDSSGCLLEFISKIDSLTTHECDNLFTVLYFGGFDCRNLMKSTKHFFCSPLQQSINAELEKDFTPETLETLIQQFFTFESQVENKKQELELFNFGLWICDKYFLNNVNSNNLNKLILKLSLFANNFKKGSDLIDSDAYLTLLKYSFVEALLNTNSENIKSKALQKIESNARTYLPEDSANQFHKKLFLQFLLLRVFHEYKNNTQTQKAALALEEYCSNETLVTETHLTLAEYYLSIKETSAAISILKSGLAGKQNIQKYCAQRLAELI